MFKKGFAKKDSLNEEFEMVIRNMDLDDWRSVRTDCYWKTDSLGEREKLQARIELIRFYNARGFPKC